MLLYSKHVHAAVCVYFRLYDIAADAELQEKSKSDLIRVTNLVIDRCRQTMANCEAETGSLLSECFLLAF